MIATGLVVGVGKWAAPAACPRRENARNDRRPGTKRRPRISLGHAAMAVVTERRSRIRGPSWQEPLPNAPTGQLEGMDGWAPVPVQTRKASNRTVEEFAMSTQATSQLDTSMKWKEMTGMQKVVFIGKFAVFLATFGFVFPNVLY